MIKFEKFQLENGLRVIHHKDTATPLVCMNILYDVGARDEDPEKTGFAHLFEHLMFGGSENIPNYDEPLQKAGGENNAFTTNDITNYYLTVPSNNVETAFWLESDRMMNLAFSEKSLEVQRNVVIEEFKQRYLNQPYGDVWLLLRPLVYKIHPYRWATIGKDISHIEHANIDDVKNFFGKFYTPDNAILSIAGNISLEQAKELTGKWFGPIQPGKHKRKRNLPAEPVQEEERILKVERDVPVNAIYKVYHTCSRYDNEFHTIDIISDILGRGKSSRLYTELVKKKKVFSEIDASTSGDMDKGIFIISGKLSQGVAMEDANQEIENVIGQLTKERISEEELDKVKNKIESTLVFSEMDIFNKAMNMATFELLGDASMINTEIDKYAEVTAANVIEQAGNLFKNSNCSTLFYMKK